MSPEFSESPSFIFAIQREPAARSPPSETKGSGLLKDGVFFSPVTLDKSLRLAPLTQIESLSQPSQLINTPRVSGLIDSLQ